MLKVKEYILTEEEQKACVDFVRKMRKEKTKKEKVFAIDFTGCVRVKAKTLDEANNIFWEWVTDIQDRSINDWYEVVTQCPHFETVGFGEK